jgi:HK97 family phage portal protein
MNLLQRLWNRVRWKPLHRGHVGTRQAGVYVTEDTSQTHSAVTACGRIITETLASLPWQVYRKLAVGREALGSSGVNWLLNHQPNPEQTAMVWRRQLLHHFLFWGNGYAEIERGQDGRAVWLWPLLPDRTEIRRSETGALVCLVRGEDGKLYVMPRENVFHLADGSYDGIMGASRIQLARRSIGAAIAQDTFTSSFYENGASIGGVIEQKTGKTLSPGGRKEMLREFNEEHAGPSRARKTLYLDAGMEYRPLTMPLHDAEFMESRRFSVEEICRWFGVPQHLVQSLIETNYAISYTADKNFVEHTLRPIATLMEQEANVRLFGARAMGNVYTRMNLGALMRGDPKVRGEWYKAMINAGVMSINEVRELEELNAIGPEGDEHYLQTSMTTLERIAEGTNITQPASPKAEPQPDEPAAEPQPSNVIEGRFRVYPLGAKALREQKERSNG